MDTAKIADNYRKRAAEFTRRVEGVPAGSWEAPTPCDGWNARDLLSHVIETHTNMAGYVGLELVLSTPLDDDPVAAWHEVRAAVEALLDDPAKSSLEFDGMLGRTSVGTAVDNFVGFDLIVHSWDLARATGQDESLPPDEIRWIAEMARGLGDGLRQEGGFGPEVTVPESASEQDRMLAFLGRRP